MKKVLLIILVFALNTFSQFVSAWDGVPDVIRNTKAYKRFEWFYRPRTNEIGVFPKEHIAVQKALEDNKVALRNSSLKKSLVIWTNLGPKGIDMSSSFIPYWGTVSGRVRGMAIHPTDPNTVYIGAAAGGIWKTIDGGTSWTDISNGLNLLTFGAIAIDPGNAQILYAGTGESRYFFNNVTYEGDGIYKSVNGGTLWTKLSGALDGQTHFSDVAVSPHNSNIILASTGSGNWNHAYPSRIGVYRSSDGGTNWSLVLNLPHPFDVAFHPTNTNIAYAAIGGKVSASGFYISTDAGLTWTQSNTGLPSATLIGRMQFDIALSSPLTIYTYIYSNSALPGGRTTVAYKSTDGGANWSQISSGVNIAGSYDGTNVNDQGSYDLCLAVSPTDANKVYFGNVEISKTTDGSAISFVRNPSGYGGGTGAWSCYTHVDIHTIKFAPSNSSVIYVGCDGGVYKSTDGGSNWSSKNNDINTIQFYRLASHPSNPSILFGGAQDNGNFKTLDKGATKWTFAGSGDGMSCFVDYNNPNNVFMSTQNGSLIRSTDGGINWADILYDLETNTAWTAPFWQHPTTSTNVYAALSRKIYLSTNSGTNWSVLSGDLGSVITYVAQSKPNVNKMLAVASDYTVYPSIFKSTDAGASWNSTSSVSGANIQCVVADPTNEDVFYIGTASFSTSNTPGQIYKTSNFGTTWNNITSDLPKVPVNAIFIDPLNTNHIYAGNDFGVYWSSNNGTNWTKLSDGMPFVPVLDFSFYSNGGTRYLRAATHGRGVYEININEPLPVELVSFTAIVKNEIISLKWKTATELNNIGFDIERSLDGEIYTKIGFIKGNGNSNSSKEYYYDDVFVNGSPLYRLKQLNTDGTFTYSNPIKVDATVIKEYILYQNYPSPFNPTTQIKYKLARDSKVKVLITDAVGREVDKLIDGEQIAGIYNFVWNASKFSSGIYFCTLTASSLDGSNVFYKTQKMVLMK